MRDLQPGLWRWEAPHPDWTPANTEGWGPEVSSYAIDPVARPSELEELAADRETVIVLTNPWHERDAAALWSDSAHQCSCRSRTTSTTTSRGCA